ncbi:Glucose-1-phosphate cytidylyltransferase [hydrothermal vent metagenome]|uniref:Glucose-1-phosphate cytidylyltransferase n=1 Tax=hydrothermal vent metagenome TaxID=652676 RepID=A0A3B1BBW2_9ZZZZ
MNKDIPVIILCGGQGTRLRNVSETLPKPMVNIGPYPMLWHIMMIYASSGYKNFILALGYKSWVIKEYFLNYRFMTSDFTINLGTTQEVKIINHHEPLDWNITFAETGEESQTGKRVLLCEKYVSTPEFMVTYGDGVADIDISRLHNFHHQHGKSATLTGVCPTGRFGALVADGTCVTEFSEKKDAGGGLINGGFFVFNRNCFDILRETDNTMLETEPMRRLVEQRELQLYRHEGFWEPMDTMREYNMLNRYWESGVAPWKVW